MESENETVAEVLSEIFKAYDMSDGCKPGLCNYYKREKESEMAS